MRLLCGTIRHFNTLDVSFSGYRIYKITVLHPLHEFPKPPLILWYHSFATDPCNVFNLIPALIVSRNKREKLACEEPIYWLAGKMRISVTSEIYMERAAYGNSLNRKEKKKSKKRTMREIRYEGWILWFLSTALEKAGCHLER